VDDLSRAHIAVFEKLNEPGVTYFYNLGTGTPNSVREIIDAVEKVTGLKVPVVESERRAGDPPALYADSSKAQKELGWEIQYTEIEDIIATAWKWHQANPEGFGV
jgi:UDP-glucose 4-epimerase